MTTKPPVSIIVRTKDRPKLLKRALGSIAAQTYRPIEVVLVNDGGCELDIEEIKSILGDASLNYQRLEKNTGRAHAGNVGIENARGEYIGFLDDNDEIYSEHVETLTTFLKQSDYKVAYTDTETVFMEFPPKKERCWMSAYGYSEMSCKYMLKYIRHCLGYFYNKILQGKSYDIITDCFGLPRFR